MVSARMRDSAKATSSLRFLQVKEDMGQSSYTNQMPNFYLGPNSNPDPNPKP